MSGPRKVLTLKFKSKISLRTDGRNVERNFPSNQMLRNHFLTYYSTEWKLWTSDEVRPLKFTLVTTALWPWLWNVTFSGTLELRKSIAKWHQRHGEIIAPEQIMVGNDGSKELIFLIIWYWLTTLKTAKKPNYFYVQFLFYRNMVFSNHR